MKLNVYSIGLAGLLIGITGCYQPDAESTVQLSNPLVESNIRPISKPKLTKKVNISIHDVKKIYSSDVSVAFPVERESSPEVAVYWNGYGFISEDSGRKFWQYSNDLAFEKQTARFVIKKKIEIVDANNQAFSNILETSQDITVKRGIPAVF